MEIRTTGFAMRTTMLLCLFLWVLQAMACSGSTAGRGAQTSPAEPPVPSGAEDAVRLAKQDVARRESVPSDQVRLVDTHAMEWPDSGLGVREPGKMYAQVLTPGYRLELELRGQRYVYHASRTSVIRASPRP